MTTTSRPDSPTGTPQRPGWDRTIDLRRWGYELNGRLQRSAPGTLAHQFRLLGRPAVLVGGAEGVRLFYDPERMQRHGAMPRPLLNVLFGRGAVHSLDGERHALRKALFLTTLDDASAAALGSIAARRWQQEISAWRLRGSGEVFAGAIDVFGAAVLHWAGLPPRIAQDRSRARDLAAIIDGFGSVGAAQLRARAARRRCERWARKAVRLTRAGGLHPPEGGVLQLVAGWRDVDGGLLDERTAAVELLNVLRPSVAVAWFAAFAALALIEHPDLRDGIAAETGEPVDSQVLTEAFAHEVRRFYPFVPMLPAKARTDLQVDGIAVRRGQRVLLDIFGIDHDEHNWPAGDTFDPGRFLAEPRLVSSDVFVPQGGGSPATGHRCPGEGVTTALLMATLSALAPLSWTVPAQDLSLPMRRMPTRPRSGVVLTLPGAGPTPARPPAGPRPEW